MTGKTAASLLTPDVLLRAYSIGLFPMAESAEDPDLHWVEPHLRGVFPLDRFHVPSKLARLVRSDRFKVTVNQDFARVMELCAAPAAGRETTWINGLIRRLYGDLHLRGHAHSVEVWDDAELVGGLYGVDAGGVFCGESMFYRRSNASKFALLHLVEHLKSRGATWLDIQVMTPHFEALGAEEIARVEFLEKLEETQKLKLKLF